MRVIKDQIALNDAAMREKIDEVEHARDQRTKDRDRIASLQKEHTRMREQAGPIHRFTPGTPWFSHLTPRLLSGTFRDFQGL